jgi:hypothetical protein
MKLILGIICVVLGVIVGYRFSDKFTQRKKFFNDFKLFNDLLKTEVAFSQRTIKSLYNRFEQSLFINYIKGSCACDKELKFVNSDEKKFTKEYCVNISKTDKFSLLNYLNNITKTIDDSSKKATEDEKKYKTLYIKLGFLIGLIILVVLL